MLAVLFLALLAAAALLSYEVATGRSAPASGVSRWGRAAAFALAAVAGGVLLVALPLDEWVLLLALLPLTTISLLRFTTLAPLAGWRRVALVGVVVLAGVAAGTQRVSVPLTRAHIQSVLPGAEPVPSARPEAGRLIRA